MRRYLPFLIVGAVLILTVGGGLLLFRSHTSTPLKIAVGKPGAEPPYIRGSANARVTLEEFGDFQCPPCSFLAATLLKVEHDYAESVRVVFRQFPLAMHPHAMTAARAAEAAGLQGRFWEMHDLLFQNATVWGKEPGVPSPIAAPLKRAQWVFERSFLATPPSLAWTSPASTRTWTVKRLRRGSPRTRSGPLPSESTGRRFSLSTAFRSRLRRSERRNCAG